MSPSCATSTTAPTMRFSASARSIAESMEEVVPATASVLISSVPERRHHVLGEPLELLLEFLRPDAFRPVNHEVLEPGIFGLDRLDAVDHLLGRTAEPGLLLHALRERGDFRGRAGRAPGAALLVGIAHESEWREPLVALVMRRLDAPHRLGLRAREIHARAPDHVL